MRMIDFEFADKRLSDFGCIVCHTTSNGGVQDIDIGGNTTFETVKNNQSSINYQISTSYDNTYIFSFDIQKHPRFRDVDKMYMSAIEIRDLTKWLKRRVCEKFKPYYNDDYTYDTHFYGRFDIKHITVGGNVVALSLTFTTNAPYGFGEEIYFQTFTSKKNEQISIYGDSDDWSYIYPEVKIKCLSDGTLKITNLITGVYTEIKNCKKNEEITMNGEHKIILSNNDSHTTLPSDFNYEFLEICADEYDCENIYEISIPCDITLAYSPIRKVGVY